MDENLENQINDAMKNAEKNASIEASAQIAEVVAVFYKGLLDNGVPKLVALALTNSFISTSFGKNG